MTLPAAELPGMSDAEFRMLCNLVRSHCGLHFGSESRYLLERRLGRRLQELQLRSFTAYHYLLRSDPGREQELAWVVDALTTNETFFFRERKQLCALIEEIIPERRAASPAGCPVAIWSAGCSSGEEPYSVVMLGLEAGLEPERDFRVYASDISQAMLQKARRGVYREASFRETEAALRERYFSEKDQLYRISDEVKKHVHFAHLNLLDASRIALLGPMDVILCRNVLIYFDLATRQRVIQTFHDKLRGGGYLLLGHAESLLNLSNDFELCHLQNDMVYRKPGMRAEPGHRWQRAAEAALGTLSDEEGQP